jgi:PAS domain S-box-containing protein
VPTGGVQQRLSLPPAPESARDARRFVAQVLSAARAGAFEDTATLLTSELVTNGIVHAHTDLQIRVEATAAWVRVEVVDGDPHLPTRRDYDEHASTGRGLEMVELLADDFGVEPLDDDSKRVWFRLGVVPGAPGNPAPSEGDSRRSTTPLRLRNLPVTLYCAWQQQADALLREATLLALDDDGGKRPDYPLAGHALGALAEAAHDVWAMRDDEVSTADVYLEVASDATSWFPILREMLTSANAMAQAGETLTPQSLPELVALRNWICDEIARQSAGLPPTPWAELDVDDGPPLVVSAATLDAVRAAATAQIAADATNRIVAISASAGELLGWTGAELEGRRLVAIIPPRLRDRHVAGFTRQLLDRTSTILGRPVEVPALCRDGSEVMVTLLIERRPDPATRALFVATLTPSS